MKIESYVLDAIWACSDDSSIELRNALRLVPVDETRLAKAIILAYGSLAYLKNVLEEDYDYEG